LQLWRSIAQWVGGVGIAVLALTFSSPADDAGAILQSEVGASFGKGPSSSAKWMWTIYGVATAIACALFSILGMPWWESLNHGLTTVSTGGLTVTDDSFASYSSAIQSTAITIMICSAISFAFYFRLGSGKWTKVRRHISSIGLFFGILIATAILASHVQTENMPDAGLSTLFFQVSSAFATAGFTTTDLSGWAPGTLMVLSVCMFIGGASGSTAGGIKVQRVVLISRAIWWRIEREILRGKRKTSRVIMGEVLSEREARMRVEAAATLAAAWLGTIALGSIVLNIFVPDEISFDQVIFEVVSALSSVGLSAGVTSPNLSESGKLTLTALMWIGRLELFAGIYLLMIAVLPARRKPDNDESDAAA